MVRNFRLTHASSLYTGKVVKNVSYRSRKGAIKYLPEIEFRYQQQTLRMLPVRINSCSSPCYNQGEEIKFYYNPLVSEHILLDNWQDKYLIMSLFLFGAGIFIFVIKYQEKLYQLQRLIMLRGKSSIAQIQSIRRYKDRGKKLCRLELMWDCPHTHKRIHSKQTLLDRDEYHAWTKGLEVEIKTHSEKPKKFLTSVSLNYL